VTQISHIDGRGLSLAEAFRVTPGEVVALVGGGGKTSAMFRLASELTGGGRVVVTTTTHIYPPQPDECPTVVLAPSLDRLLEEAARAFATSRMITVSRGLNPDGRLSGIDPDWIVPLQQALGHPTILVEADGSKGRPLKAPAAHEPVIPASATLVIPVVGLSVIGSLLHVDSVHRPEIVAALAGAKLGDTVSPELVAAVLSHIEGGRRGAPPGARIVPLLNQADDESRLDHGRNVARHLIARGVSRVVIGVARQPQPVREVIRGEAAPGPVTAIVLAAGLGRRMGRLKMGLPLGGKPLLRHVVDAALASEADEIMVVLGHAAAELEPYLPSTGRLRVVHNPDYAVGQSTSVKSAIRALRPETEAVLFLLGDQPTIAPEIINAVIRAFRTGCSPLVQPEFRGTTGHPVLFARPLFVELLMASGDEGGREVLKRHRAERTAVPFDLDPPGDVDTVADYERMADFFRRD
jgi:molybdenum cofactor cytidylyltransferase